MIASVTCVKDLSPTWDICKYIYIYILYQGGLNKKEIQLNFRIIFSILIFNELLYSPNNS